tara:strand:- start:451 stop:765 length:315 start_codon:yes stop_codon:yes gene_type:complete
MIKLMHKKKAKLLLSPLPIEDIEIFQSLKEVLDCLCNDVWGFELQNQSSINGQTKWVLRRGKNTISDTVCVIETFKNSKENVFITMYSKDDYLRNLVKEGRRLL